MFRSKRIFSLYHYRCLATSWKSGLLHFVVQDSAPDLATTLVASGSSDVGIDAGSTPVLAEQEKQ